MPRCACYVSGVVDANIKTIYIYIIRMCFFIYMLCNESSLPHYLFPVLICKYLKYMGHDNQGEHKSAKNEEQMADKTHRKESHEA